MLCLQSLMCSMIMCKCRFRNQQSVTMSSFLIGGQACEAQSNVLGKFLCTHAACTSYRTSCQQVCGKLGWSCSRLP